MAGQLSDPIIALVEEQVKAMGGILGGRPVQFVRGDNASDTAGTLTAARKLIQQDNVSVLTEGGVSSAQCQIVDGVAQELKVLFVTFGAEDISPYNYTIRGVTGEASITQGVIDVVTKTLKPKTVAFISLDDSYNNSVRIPAMKAAFNAIGAQTVSVQIVPNGTVDYTPYLTKLKYLNPNVALFSGNMEDFATIVRQIMELGGWGNITPVSMRAAFVKDTILKQPGAQGWYSSAPWMIGLQYPGAKSFEDAFRNKYGKDPGPNDVFAYNPFWLAINAIQLAGTDNPAKVAEAARSGKLEWDSPMGHVHITPDGENGLSAVMVHSVGGGKVVPAAMP